MSSIALDFAQEAGDETLISYILMRRSNIATDAKRPELALKLADAALGKATCLPPRYCAVALRQRAHSFAQLAQSDDCAHTLEGAFKFAERSVDSEKDLAQYCTPEYVEMEAAHCWIELGQSDKAIGTLRGFYVPYSDGVDMVTPVVTRAMTAIDQLRHTGGPTPDDDDRDDEAEQVDHLANVQVALRGERRVRTQVVLTRLAELNPTVYEDWTFQDLSAALADYDIEPVKSGGVKVVRATDVTHALAYRDRQKDTEGDG